MLRRQKRYRPYSPWEHILSSIWVEDVAAEVDEGDDDTYLFQVCCNSNTSKCSTCDFYVCSGCMRELTCEIEVTGLLLIYFYVFLNA